MVERDSVEIECENRTGHVYRLLGRQAREGMWFEGKQCQRCWYTEWTYSGCVNINDREECDEADRGL